MSKYSHHPEAGENLIRLPHEVCIEDVTLRDGLQGVERLFTVKEKLDVVMYLIKAGVKRIQVGSFVHPEKVPQMANTEALLQVLPNIPGVTYTVLVLNETGLERAVQAGVHHLYMAISATETHNQKNTHCTLAEAKERIGRMIIQSKRAHLTVRAGIMMAFGCAYEGSVPEEVVLDLAQLYYRLGADMIDLADTAGMANPKKVFELVRKVRSTTHGLPISLHLHDTCGMGLANLLGGLAAGVTHFDASVAGLGGCPFIPHPAGNIATEEAVHMIEAMGIHSGISERALIRLAKTFPVVSNFRKDT